MILRFLFALFLSFVSAPAWADTVHDERTLRLYNVHTSEIIEVLYKLDGKYNPAALSELEWFLRDPATEQTVRIDKKLLDALWLVSQSVGGPLSIVYGHRHYESKTKPNSSSRSGQHMLGRAVDVFIPGMKANKLRLLVNRIKGVGAADYPNSGVSFIHLYIK